jgi:SanA protein
MILLVGAIGIAVLTLPRGYAAVRYHGAVRTAADAPSAPVAIVFGAGIQADGSPSLILADRVATAADLYRSGKVAKLLLSGDNRFVDYNEPQSMYDYGLRLGIPASAMVRDYAGRRTYDTCLRARDIFRVNRALLVSQAYHLDRALLTCETLGIEVQGVSADRSAYPSEPFRGWWMRELPAATGALWDLLIMPPRNVVLGDPLPI